MRGLLLVTLATQLLLYVSLGVSIVAPRRRIWPPPSRDSWRFYLTWFGSWITLSGAFLLAVLDKNSLGLGPTLRFGGGVPLLLVGVALIGWGSRTLSLHTSLGLGGQLIRSGPYRWSRNPQYVGACAYLAALTLLSGSLFTGIACLSIALWHLLLPFAEEPWLAQQFGAEYEEYRSRVPRFLGLPHRAKKAVTLPI
jgi:protein-S-isoprenylcysteine O-methyltransferase Ste14